MSIHDWADKIKGKTGIDNTTFLYLFLIIGVGVASFGLGRLSTDASPKEVKGIEISQQASAARTISNTSSRNIVSTTNTMELSSGKKYVASKNGKLYYPSTCKGANRIKEENKVWFDNASEAESLGYTWATSCK